MISDDSFFEIIPTCASIFACATEPRMSNSARSLSNDTDSLNLSMRRLGPFENLPPQLACSFFAFFITKKLPLPKKIKRRTLQKPAALCKIYQEAWRRRA